MNILEHIAGAIGEEFRRHDLFVTGSIDEIHDNFYVLHGNFYIKEAGSSEPSKIEANFFLFATGTVRLYTHFGIFSPDKRIRMLEECNRLNCEYSEMRFSIRDNRVWVELDIPKNTANIGEIAFQSWQTFAQVIEHELPALVSAMQN